MKEEVRKRGKCEEERRGRGEEKKKEECRRGEEVNRITRKRKKS